ncbi:hypothetical protein LSM04_005306 [Trypanosoma melophagium]|uniref:uncharacterized protein n=1 Tax=Trypanosoma melophagium TaxID=715481 RepID=UPI00351A2202|nr:hypothetical protein LSM04_005306 [Trypanosoma melophagium]
MTMDCNNNDNNSNDMDIKTCQLLEVSRSVKQALYQARRESLWSPEENVGTRLLTGVVFPSKTSLSSGDVNIPRETLSLSSSMKLVETATKEVHKGVEKEEKKIREVCDIPENETGVSDNPFMVKVNKEEEEETTEIPHDGREKPNISNHSENKKNILLSNNTDNNTLMSEVGEDVRVPPCVLIGLASPIIIEEYLVNTENTNKDSQRPLNGYFLEPYTGVFFVNGVPSQMFPIHQMVSVLPASPVTVTMTVDIHLQVLNIIMDAEVVLVFPLSLCTSGEILQLRPVVQIFSSGAVVDIH